MRVLLKSPFSPLTGYGNDGIGLAQALTRWGVDVYLRPEGIDPPLPRDIAYLLTKRIEGPFDLAITHVPLDQGGGAEFRLAADVAVGWTMWESTTFDNLDDNENLRERLVNFDAVLAYDEVTKGALDAHTDQPIMVLQGGYDSSQWRPMLRDWTSSTFRFCMVGQLHDRKHPFASINAFKELKEEFPKEFAGAELHLKTMVPGLHPRMEQWCPGLYVHYAQWSQEQLAQFYSEQHVLLAPSRGEGKNLPALEFMSTGGAVIATNWGGHRQWMSSDYAYPLGYTLVPVDSRYSNCLSARADQDELKSLMLHVFRNRGEAREKGAIAERIIPSMCSWDAVVVRLWNVLADSVPGGEMVRNKALGCQRLPRDIEVRV